MCEITYNDKWFFDNGYWRLICDKSAPYKYCFPNPEEKWRELSETLLRETSIIKDGRVLIKIITPDMVCRAIESGNTKRDKRKSHNYIKKRDRLLKDDD